MVNGFRFNFFSPYLPVFKNNELILLQIDQWGFFPMSLWTWEFKFIWCISFWTSIHLIFQRSHICMGGWGPLQGASLALLIWLQQTLTASQLSHMICQTPLAVNLKSTLSPLSLGSFYREMVIWRPQSGY